MDEKRRLFKRIFIAIIYSVIFAGFGTGVYFLVRPAPASLPALPVAIYPIEVIWSRAFAAGPGLYSVAARIRNPNTGFGASNFNYAFYLYDADGALITASAGLSAQTGESFIWPGESKYIILGGVNLAGTPAKTLLKIGNPAWREVKNFRGVDLTLENISYREEKAGSGKFFSVDFTASNGTLYDLGKVYVSAVVLDKSESPIATASTLLENLKSKERRPFGIPWFSPFSGTPNRVDLGISTNLWENPELIGQ